MTETPADQYLRYRKEIHHDILLPRTQNPGHEWMTVPEIGRFTKASKDTIITALNDLGRAGLVTSHLGSYRARGTLATPGSERDTMTETARTVQPVGTEPHPPCKRRHEEPADAAQRRAEYLRKEALAFALTGDTDGYTHEEIVTRATVFETYLAGKGTGPGNILTRAQATQVEGALEGAEATLAMLDAPETLEAVRSALAIIDVAIMGTDA